VCQLDGSLAGDVGFDPLGLSSVKDVGLDLYWFREAELKHCRYYLRDSHHHTKTTFHRHLTPCPAVSVVRLGMLAAAGIIFVEAFGPIPGFVSTHSIKPT
jgi:light-harvesting complex I chlorophyll a/b binding protein 1